MFSLILKDVLLLRKTIIFSVLYMIFMLFVFSGLDSAAGVFSICVVAITYMLMISGCALDEKNKADVMLNSLPLNRACIVGARYLMIFAYVLFTVVVYSLATWVISLINLNLNLYFIGLGGFLGAVFATSLLASLYLPFYFKFGYIKSKIYHFILFFGLFFGINVVASSLAKNPDNPVFKGMEAFLMDQSDFMSGSIIAGVAIAMLVISYVISLKVYKNREF